MLVKLPSLVTLIAGKWKQQIFIEDDENFEAGEWHMTGDLALDQNGRQGRCFVLNHAAFDLKKSPPRLPTPKELAPAIPNFDRELQYQATSESEAGEGTNRGTGETTCDTDAGMPPVIGGAGVRVDAVPASGIEVGHAPINVGFGGWATYVPVARLECAHRVEEFQVGGEGKQSEVVGDYLFLCRNRNWQTQKVQAIAFCPFSFL